VNVDHVEPPPRGPRGQRRHGLVGARVDPRALDDGAGRFGGLAPADGQRDVVGGRHLGGDCVQVRVGAASVGEPIGHEEDAHRGDYPEDPPL